MRPSVLLVEDNPTDEMLVNRTIAKSEIDCEVHLARDGADACEILLGSKAGAFSLVILDINLPKLNGFEVLERIRACDRLAGLPVVMFSSSDEPRDLYRAARIGASSFVQKHVDFSLFESRLKLLLYYWLFVHQAYPSSVLQGYEQFETDRLMPEPRLLAAPILL